MTRNNGRIPLRMENSAHFLVFWCSASIFYWGLFCSLTPLFRRRAVMTLSSLFSAFLFIWALVLILLLFNPPLLLLPLFLLPASTQFWAFFLQFNSSWGSLILISSPPHDPVYKSDLSLKRRALKLPQNWTFFSVVQAMTVKTENSQFH